jgi:ubiquinone/menaquinone biosynthesis C-methylase UbiE/nucleoside phosphorylase
MGDPSMNNESLMAQQNQVDIAILVPKADELKAVEWAFGTTFERSDGWLSGGKPYYKLNHKIETESGTSDVSIAVIFMNDQGTGPASTVTQQVISELDPVIFFLTGTAAGREGKVGIGSVIVSSMVIDATQWRVEESASPRALQYEPPEKVRTDAVRFVEKFPLDKWQKELLSIPVDLYRGKEPPDEILKEGPDVKYGFVSASNYLLLNPGVLGVLWTSDDRIRCIDMESGGFGSSCKGSVQRQWLVVRGISDYGTPASRKEVYRVAAAASAAIFLRMFIERGLIESHPHWLRVPESRKSELSPDNPYSQYDIVSTVTEGVKKELGIDLSGIDLSTSLCLADFESVCISRGANAEQAHNVLSAIREKYFTEKYVEYNYERDLRGLLPNWATEIKDILTRLTIDLSSSTVLDVGIGNGLEIPYLFTETGKVIGVDVSSSMLDKAKHLFPSLEIVHNPAENLSSIETSSVDAYISLRTFQSSLFDISAAMREAQRVLKSKGIIVVSIANGFVDLEDSKKKIVRGLLIPGSRRIVDKSTPKRIADHVYQRFEELGFEVGYRIEKTDIYVWGRKP